MQLLLINDATPKVSATPTPLYDNNGRPTYTGTETINLSNLCRRNVRQIKELLYSQWPDNPFTPPVEDAGDYPRFVRRGILSLNESGQYVMTGEQQSEIRRMVLGMPTAWGMKNYCVGYDEEGKRTIRYHFWRMSDRSEVIKDLTLEQAKAFTRVHWLSPAGARTLGLL